MFAFSEWKAHVMPGRIQRPLLLLTAVFYLSYHALNGDRGLYALFKEHRKLEALTLELSEAKAEREALHRRVNHLYAESLDADLLDEQARHMLGLMGTDEVMVLYLDGDSK